MLRLLLSIHASVKAWFLKRYRTAEILKVYTASHNEELKAAPINEWPMLQAVHAKQIAEIKKGRFAAGNPIYAQGPNGEKIVDRRSWIFPYLPSSTTRMAVPLMKMTAYSLRRMSRTPVARRAINLVKGAVITQPWDVTPLDDVDALDDENDQAERIKIAKKMFNHPNNTDSFQVWAEMGIDDICCYGAFVSELRFTADPERPLKMWICQPESIRLFPGWSESTPDYPHYAQMTGLKGERGAILFYDDEMLYIKDNPSSDNPFGFGRMETAFTSLTYLLGIQDMSGKAGSDQIHKCFPGTTEVLTRRGWVPWSDVGDYEEFATRSSDGKFQWQKALGFVREQHDGDMIQFNSRELKITVTPNHRMYGKRQVKDWKTGKKVWRPTDFIEAKDLVAGSNNRPGKGWRLKANKNKPTIIYDFKIPTRTSWEEGCLPSSVCRIGTRTFKWADWAAFLGIWIAEGSCLIRCGEYRVQIAQSKKANFWKYNEIKKLLDKMGISYKERYDRLLCNDKSICEYLVSQGNQHARYVPQWVKDAPKKLIQIFFDFAHMGDGSKRGTRRLYYTVSKRLADDMQELYQKIGSSAASHFVTHKGKQIYCVEEMMREEISIVPAGARGKDRKPKTIKYSGMVYCAMVPNGTLYCRENGYAFWSGNTFLWWTNPQSDAAYQIIRRHIQNELEGQAKVAIIGGMQKPDVLDINPVQEGDLLLNWQEMLIRMVANAFDLSAMSLGIEHDVNRATGAVLSDQDFRSAIVPLARRLQEAFTRNVLHNKLGWTDLQFKFMSLDDPDVETKIGIYQKAYGMNSSTPNQFRTAMGWKALDNPFADLTQIEAMIVNQIAAAKIQLETQKQMMQLQQAAQSPAGPDPSYPTAPDQGYDQGSQDAPYDQAQPAPAAGSTGSGAQPKAAATIKAPTALKLPQFPISGSKFNTQQIAAMSVDQLDAAFSNGDLPDPSSTVEEMDNQNPSILDELSDEIKEYLQQRLEQEANDKKLKKPSATWLRKWKLEQKKKAWADSKRITDFAMWIQKNSRPGRPGSYNTNQPGGTPGNVNNGAKMG